MHVWCINPGQKINDLYRNGTTKAIHKLRVKNSLAKNIIRYPLNYITLFIMQRSNVFYDFFYNGTLNRLFSFRF